jgi:hypothetical protein
VTFFFTEVNVCVKALIPEDPKGALPPSEAMSHLISMALGPVEPSTDACVALRSTGMLPSMPPNLD